MNPNASQFGTVYASGEIFQSPARFSKLTVVILYEFYEWISGVVGKSKLNDLSHTYK